MRKIADIPGNGPIADQLAHNLSGQTPDLSAGMRKTSRWIVTVTIAIAIITIPRITVQLSEH